MTAPFPAVPGAEWSLTSADDWDAATCHPAPGSGTLARVGRVHLLVGSTDPDAVAPLLEQVELVAAQGGGGRRLVRSFALLLGTASVEPPPFVALAPHETGVAVLAVGDAVASIDGVEISGRDSLAWAEKLVPWPVSSVEARVDAGAQPRPHLRLDAGVVEAGGFALGAVVASSAAIPADAVSPAAVQPAPFDLAKPAAAGEPESEPEPIPEPVPAEPEPVAVAVPEPTPVPDPAAPPAPPAPPAPVDFDVVKLDDLDEPEPLPPLPLPSSAPGPAAPADDAVQVRGVYCKNRHFNDPDQLFCAICGINMVQQTPVLVHGPRPPLGVIVLDDGAVFQLDRDYLLGRDPSADERVRSGVARGVPLEDTSHQVSRVHARIELRGWEVVLVDNSSTNGTYVAPPDSPGWHRLPTAGEQRLTQGTRVRIGHRTLAFNTHAGQ